MHSSWALVDHFSCSRWGSVKCHYFDRKCSSDHKFSVADLAYRVNVKCLMLRVLDTSDLGFISIVINSAAEQVKTGENSLGAPTTSTTLGF